MALTSIGTQLTPGRPIEITFAAQTGLPSDVQEVLLIGHKGATGSATAYQVTQISNVADVDAATTEANAKFGSGSELAKMVIAAVTVNQGGGTFPAIKCVALDAADTDFGASDIALTNASKVKAEYIVSPYDASTATALRTKLRDTCSAMSGAQRVHNNQFGTIGVAANFSVADPATLDAPDSQFLALMYLRDSGSNPYSVGELAAACAAKMAANGVPFNPLDDVVLTGVTAPELMSDYLSIGAGLESEVVLTAGWTPLKVKPNGDVALVRTRTTRITNAGADATAYYDVQDFNVLYFWRKTLYTRLSQPDFSNTKASQETADNILGEVIRLAQLFEDQGMFQAVSELAKSFQIERNASDRHRFDIFTPVNVIPGLHVIAANIQATVEGDTLTI